MKFDNYETDGFYDEIFESSDKPRPGSKLLIDRLKSFPYEEIKKRQKSAEAALFNMGVTFTVYEDRAGLEKIFPFDIIPRIIESAEWEILEKGLKQRIYALNQFIHDIYNDKKIVKDKVIPSDIVYSGKCYLKQCEGLNPPKQIWNHITGTDIIRDEKGSYLVLEDNLRCPSGVSYVLENRQVMKRTFPKVFGDLKVRAVDDYPNLLFEALENISIDNNSPNIVLLTPGIYNSAYFEHSYLAQQMGIELVEGRDLVVHDNFVFMRTTQGFKKVDVIYRRIDDNYLDPLSFNNDSLIGIPGIMDVYRSGNVSIANAPGTGIADDKVVYAYIPKIIKYYTGEEPVLNNVPTYICSEQKDCDYVLDHLGELVVKAANESGGYGMLIGPHSTKKEQKEFKEKIKENPRNYIAQPTITLSRVPVIVDDRLEGRHVDFRPYIIYGEDIYIMPGGLTRVALQKGSLVVNSSQGGGSKDSWVLK
ncbi:MAG: circularly permuted type 2 ATP-grasp protein [Thermodesulfobacteriota bacterium]